MDFDFVKVQQIEGKLYRDLLLNQLDLGESETIILAKELQSDLVIIDENIGYMIAENSGLNVVRTLSVLSKAKEKGIINEVKPLLDEMILKGRWYSKRVYDSFLKRIGEV